MQVAFYLTWEITQVKESIPWVRCASDSVLDFQIAKLTVVDLSANFWDTQTELLILNLYNWKLEKLPLSVHWNFLELKQNIVTLKDPQKELLM